MTAAEEFTRAETDHRGVWAGVVIEDWEDDPRYVRVSLHVEPVPRGTDTEVHSLLVRAPAVPPVEGERE